MRSIFGSYLGSFLGNELDAKRHIENSILLDVFLPSDFEDGVVVSALTGHAGAGTTIVLKRLAWDAANNHNKPVLYISGQGIFRADLIDELIDLIQERLFIIVDDTPSHARTITEDIREFKRNGRNISFLLAGRSNEWNMYCDQLNAFVDNVMEIDDLSRKEIEGLIEKLDKNHCLGVLEDYTLEERIKIFEGAQSANRQLLVALYQATQGKDLAEIARDEYNRIHPTSVQTLYADICTLNRFGAPVRAGLIARLSNIRIEDFRKRFMLPLEQVVIVDDNARNADFTYRARHSQIAEWVFDAAFDCPDRKVSQLIRFLSCLNTDYVTDNDAMEKMLRGKSLADAFDDKRLVDRLYTAAIEANVHESYIRHQRANYELNHSGSDFRAALGYINKSMALANRVTLAHRHTKARVLRALANKEQNQLQKQRNREEIFELFSNHMQRSKDTRPYCLVIDTAIDQLDELKNDSSNEADIPSLIARIQRYFNEGFQKFSDDPHLLVTQSRFSDKLNEIPQSLEMLNKAFRKDKSNPYIAIRLARRLVTHDELSRAQDILRSCLAGNPTDKHLNLEMVKSLMLDLDASMDAVEQYLNRSFTRGDGHHEARFLAARYYFLNSKERRALELFRELKESTFSMGQKKFIRKILKDSENGEKTILRGKVLKRTDAFAFIRCNRFGTDIHMRGSATNDESAVSKFNDGQEVVFNLGFCYLGPEAVNVRKVS